MFSMVLENKIACILHKLWKTLDYCIALNIFCHLLTSTTVFAALHYISKFINCI